LRCDDAALGQPLDAHRQQLVLFFGGAQLEEMDCLLAADALNPDDDQ